MKETYLHIPMYFSFLEAFHRNYFSIIISSKSSIFMKATNFKDMN